MERWLDKVLNSLHPVINPRNVGLENTRKISIKTKKDRKDNAVTRAKVRVDNYHLIS
jgi:hypothetical protein